MVEDFMMSVTLLSPGQSVTLDILTTWDAGEFVILSPCAARFLTETLRIVLEVLKEETLSLQFSEEITSVCVH